MLDLIGFNKIKKGILLITLAFSVNCAIAEKVLVYFDSTVSQHAFAANEIKSALALKGHQTGFVPLSEFTKDGSSARIVIALNSDASVKSQYKASGGAAINDLAEQAYALRTTIRVKPCYWVLGGDINGAMYGALQLAENISFDGFGGTFNLQESPTIVNRGLKFNLPFDKRSPTYYGPGLKEDDFPGTVFRNAIKDVWDIQFWKHFFDDMALNRLNVIQLWSLHPFTSMIKLPDYPDVALQDIQGFNGFFKKMSIDEKIVFWREVMALAKNRGIQFHFMIWNLYTYGATGKYGITSDPENPATVPYMRKSIYKLFETYPDLTGFGVTAGENMGRRSEENKAAWMWDTFGQGMLDFANDHPDRKIVFIHRYHQSGAYEVAKNFSKLQAAPNVRFDFSYKYAVAHIYGAPQPGWIYTTHGNVPEQLGKLGLKTMLELRNDSFHFLNWGDPDFVREVIRKIPDEEKYIQGFVYGADGYVPTRNITSKADWAKDGLEIERQWYMYMLWGRLTYNPNLSDEVFKNTMKLKYPSAPQNLFSAWANASKAIPKMTELVQGSSKTDNAWWPETCMQGKRGLITISDMLKAEPAPGSEVCSILNTVKGECGSKKSALMVAEEMKESSMAALNEIGFFGESPVKDELQMKIGNIRAMSYLGLYYSEKVKGAIFKGSGEADKARAAMGSAYCYWKRYSALMNEMYTGMEMQRTHDLKDWLSLDKDVLKEYTDLGGTGEPVCEELIKVGKGAQP